MDFEFVQKMINLVDASRLAELEYAADGERLRLVKTPQLSAAAATTTVATAAIGAIEKSVPVATRIAPVVAASASHTVAAGLSGTFCSRPAPNEAPFVKVGDAVAEGQVLCIIEAMKMLNAVESDSAGVISAILIEEGAAVVAGTPMFLIEPN